jgi:hypothetical protein
MSSAQAQPRGNPLFIVVWFAGVAALGVASAWVSSWVGHLAALIVLLFIGGPAVSTLVQGLAERGVRRVGAGIDLIALVSVVAVVAVMVFAAQGMCAGNVSLDECVVPDDNESVLLALLSFLPLGLPPYLSWRLGNWNRHNAPNLVLHPRPDTNQDKLLAESDLSEADLELNRLGQLSAGQRAHMVKQMLSQAYFGLLLLAAGVFFFLPDLFQQLPAAQTITLTFLVEAGVLLVLLLLAFQNARRAGRIAQTLPKGSVEVASGLISKRHRSGRPTQWLLVTPDNREFQVARRVHDLIEAHRPYRVYFIAGDQVVGIEALPPLPLPDVDPFEHEYAEPLESDFEEDTEREDVFKDEIDGLGSDVDEDDANSKKRNWPFASS